MVGVPGRSKGCNTCRRRKIACSLERPHCYQCTRTGRVCLGYQRETVFVSSVRSSSAAALSPSTWKPGAYSQNDRPRSKLGPPGLDHTVIALAGDQSLQKSAQRHQVMGSFLSNFTQGADRSGAWGPALIRSVYNLPRPTKALRFSAFAICTARLGRSGAAADEALVYISRDLYGQALAKTREGLADPNLMLADETVATCLLLAMYEVYECPDNSRHAYLSHHNACARLIEMRGPKAHQTGLARKVFAAFRTMGAFESLLNRPSFLSNPEWKTTPFDGTEKSPYDRLIDILLEGPDLIRHATIMTGQTHALAKLKDAMSLARSCWRLDEAFQALYAELEQSVDGTLYWPVLSSTPGRVKETLFPTRFEFIDVKVGSTLALYWASLAILWSGMCRLYDLIDDLYSAVKAQGYDEGMESTVHDPNSLPALAQRTAFIEPAFNVCQSVETLIMESMALPLLPTSLHMVLSVLAQYPDRKAEAAWVVQAIERTRRKGMAIIGCVAMDTSPSPSAEKSC